MMHYGFPSISPWKCPLRRGFHGFSRNGFAARFRILHICNPVCRGFGAFGLEQSCGSLDQNFSNWVPRDTTSTITIQLFNCSTGWSQHEWLQNAKVWSGIETSESLTFLWLVASVQQHVFPCIFVLLDVSLHHPCLCGSAAWAAWGLGQQATDSHSIEMFAAESHLFLRVLCQYSSCRNLWGFPLFMYHCTV